MERNILLTSSPLGLDSSSGLAEGASSRKGLERMEMQDANEMEA